MTEHGTKTFEIDGKTWELWYRRGDIAHLRREVKDRDVVHGETLEVNLWAESQKRYPNEALLVAALALPNEADDPTLDGIIKDGGK